MSTHAGNDTCTAMKSDQDGKESILPSTITSEDASQPSNVKKGKNRKRNLYGKKKNRLYKGNKRAFRDDNGDENNDNSDKTNTKHCRKDREEDRNAPPHDGSFANPEMREQFNVRIDDDDDTENDKSDESDSAVTKNPKKTVAMLIGFLGTGYGGMQINARQKSIQACLELAIYRAGYISKDNFGFPPKYSWSNSARTDKGVHSCAQVCSAKLSVPPSDFVDEGDTSDFGTARRNINAHLPEDMCILDMVRTSRKFNAKTFRDKVRYEYMLPSFVLQDRRHIHELFETTARCTPPVRDQTTGTSASNGDGDTSSAAASTNRQAFADPLSKEQLDILMPHFCKYRASPETLKTLDTVLETFQGTKSFHNYTSGKTSADPSSKRYILNFQRDGDPIIDEKTGMEWIPTQITGQSFLLHQIRKMICAAIDVTRGAADLDTLKQSMQQDTKMILSIAPAQGLFLDMTYFQTYNSRRHEKRNKDNDNAVGDVIDWHTTNGDGDSKRQDAIQRWKKFKEQTVVKHVMKEEAKEHNFVKYIFVHEFCFDRTRYIHPEIENTHKR